MENADKQPLRIILTGPESTGKTALTLELARHFRGIGVEEYAREYIGNLNRKYNFNDVLHIAKTQVHEMERAMTARAEMVFFDTYLIITRVWFEFVFHEIPEWIDGEISKTADALYLLCRPDIPWTPDPLRENGGEARNILFRRYEEVLKKRNLNYTCVEGQGHRRVEHAIQNIETFLSAK